MLDHTASLDDLDFSSEAMRPEKRTGHMQTRGPVWQVRIRNSGGPIVARCKSRDLAERIASTYRSGVVVEA